MLTEVNSPLLITIISGVVSLLAILIGRMLDKRLNLASVRKTNAEADALAKKTDAEAQDLLTQAAERLVKRYEKQITDLDAKLKDALAMAVELEARLASADATMRKLELGIVVLTKQIKRHGETPDWP